MTSKPKLAWAPYLAVFLFLGQCLHSAQRAYFCQRLTWLVALGVKLFGLWDFQEFRTQGVKNHQRKSKFLVFTVESVDECLFRPDETIPLKLFRKVGIKNPPFFTQFLNQLFGPSLIKIAYVSRFGYKWILSYAS